MATLSSRRPALPRALRWPARFRRRSGDDFRQRLMALPLRPNRGALNRIDYRWCGQWTGSGIYGALEAMPVTPPAQRSRHRRCSIGDEARLLSYMLRGGSRRMIAPTQAGADIARLVILPPDITAYCRRGIFDSSGDSYSRRIFAIDVIYWPMPGVVGGVLVTDRATGPYHDQQALPR